jgi:hypothetical protein
MKHWIPTLLCVMSIGLVGVSSFGADQDLPAKGDVSKPKPKAKAAGDQSLDELLGLPSRPKSKPNTKPNTKPAGSEKKPPVDLGNGTPERDPFKLAVADMKSATSGLRDNQDVGLETQRAQERAIKRLDQLLSMLKKQQSQSSSSSSSKQKPQDGSKKNQPNQGQKKQGKEQGKQQGSKQANSQSSKGGGGGSGQAGKNDPLAERLAEWGNLPPRLRDQLLEGLDDPTSDLYRRLTERYLRRLAEENK